MRAEDRIRLPHMVEASQAAMRFASGRQRSDLQTDQMLLFAILRAIEVMGEAANKFPKTFVQQTTIFLGRRLLACEIA
jgi:uncharacterized protein with HEPN domain